ncbi:MAG: hypothetical protein S4CHLAM81_10100 [Chlamydiales bacterium]|nr:hypothetical protein [Chlamydiales bacterium]MCH9635788.1 hypothetical protein [Chlamydiales bacterium]MCH9704021.1 hypothetical protein [Chlamydiota bacterium]
MRISGAYGAVPPPPSDETPSRAAQGAYTAFEKLYQDLIDLPKSGVISDKQIKQLISDMQGLMSSLKSNEGALSALHKQLQDNPKAFGPMAESYYNVCNAAGLPTDSVSDIIEQLSNWSAILQNGLENEGGVPYSREDFNNMGFGDFVHDIAYFGQDLSEMGYGEINHGIHIDMSL